MKNAKKIVMGGVAALALVTASVMGTMAYLKSNDTVTNTFTVGNVNITLDEAKTNDDGKVVEGDGAARVKGNSYKLMPGHTYTKDPIVHVDSNSEDCYLFISVKDDIAGIEDNDTVASQITNNNWKVVSTDATNSTTVYVYAEGTDTKTVVKASEDKAVFANFKIKGDVTGETLNNSYNTGKTITVTAYAIQADGLSNETVDELWTKASTTTNN